MDNGDYDRGVMSGTVVMAGTGVGLFDGNSPHGVPWQAARCAMLGVSGAGGCGCCVVRSERIGLDSIDHVLADRPQLIQVIGTVAGPPNLVSP